MTPRPALAPALRSALTAADPDALSRLADTPAADRRDRFTALLAVYAVHTAAVPALGDAARLQHHPALAAVKSRLEDEWLAELDDAVAGDPVAAGGDVAAALRSVAARDRLPDAYRWLAADASWPEVVEFLALEGGPDAGFDDLVAACQVGLHGPAKLELAVNYWDEMGNGDPAAVHTVLHDRLVAAVRMPRLRLAEQPVSALARTALGGLLATNRWLQPEMLGALGLIELQAGPRCRLVLQAFDRLGAPADAYPFYEVHAEVDPRHGKDWVEKAVAPFVAEHPQLADRVLRGALWRSAVNAAFLADVEADLVRTRSRAA